MNRWLEHLFDVELDQALGSRAGRSQEQGLQQEGAECCNELDSKTYRHIHIFTNSSLDGAVSSRSCCQLEQRHLKEIFPVMKKMRHWCESREGVHEEYKGKLCVQTLLVQQLHFITSLKNLPIGV